MAQLILAVAVLGRAGRVRVRGTNDFNTKFSLKRHNFDAKASKFNVLNFKAKFQIEIVKNVLLRIEIRCHRGRLKCAVELLKRNLVTFSKMQLKFASKIYEKFKSEIMRQLESVKFSVVNFS
jgi:hypothetical protein